MSPALDHFHSPVAPASDVEAFSEAEEVQGEDAIAREEEELRERDRQRRRSAGRGVAGDDDDDSDDEGEDLFGDRMDRDYQPNPELDRYEDDIIDDETEHRNLTRAEVRQAEREMQERDRLRAEAERGASGGAQIGGMRGVAAMFANLGLSDDSDASAEGEDNAIATARAERRARARALRAHRDRATRPDPEFVDQAVQALPPCGEVAPGRPMAAAELWTADIQEVVITVCEGLVWFTEDEDVAPDDGADDEAGGGGGGSEAPTAQQHRSTVGGPRGIRGSEISFYVQRIQTMVRDERSFLIVEWRHIEQFCPRLCGWLTQLPQQVLGAMDQVVTRITHQMYFELYKGKVISVRIGNHPRIDTIRNLNTSHMNRLIVVEGVCMRRSDVLPRLKIVYYECVKCRINFGPFDQREMELTRQQKVCPGCQSIGPFIVSRERTLFQNYQKAVLQEVTSSVPAGHVPRQKVLILLGDLVDQVKPGDDLIVTGILEARPDSGTNARLGFPVFSTWIVANQIQKRRERQIQEMTEKDIDIIHHLSRNSMVREKLIKSIAPSLWGHRHVKTAIAMVMFGGVRNEVAGKHVVRGDINLLIVGDPGMAKSQFLKYVEQAFPRTVLTTGKGASAVGLTAAVKRDPMTGEFTLEGGAFVLADEGICLIDEFDKMSDKDRVSIHEAMEQQSISISKAGIVTSLRARCSVIAAANPIFGRYNASLPLSQNVDLTDPILSRFDVVAVVRDQSYPIGDEHLANHVIESHMDAHPEAEYSESATDGNESNRDPSSHIDNPDETLDADGYPKWITDGGPIPERVLRQYIIYARRYCKPELRASDESRLTDFYSKLREATANNGGLPLTVRHLESIMRMATANAKMRLSRFADQKDINFAISTMLESFVQSQKLAVAIDLGRRFGRYRALASSPDELLEGLLLEMLTRRAREEWARSKKSLMDKVLADGETKSMEIPLHDFKMLAKTLHGLPEVVVQTFTNCARFKVKYDLAQRDGESFIATRHVS